MGLLWVQANGPPSDPCAMCQATFHLLERSASQIVSEHAAADIQSFLEGARPSPQFLDSPVLGSTGVLSQPLFLSLYYFWINVNEVCLWLSKMDEKLARVRSFLLVSKLDEERITEDTFQSHLFSL